MKDSGCLTLVITTLLILMVGFCLSAILAYPMMLLWNWLMPIIFGLPELTFLQSFGFMILLRLLIPTSNTKTNK